MDSCHRSMDISSDDFKEKYLKNVKYMTKFVIISLLNLDLINFNVNFPNSALRFARFTRPCKYLKKNYYFYY